MSAWNPRVKERGQALPLAAAGLFCAALLFGFVLKSSERLIQRERVRARTDVTAFSGGVSYARGLNLLAASQKAVAGGWVLAVFDQGKTKAYVQRFQKHFLTAGPWITQATLINVGAENGILAAPFWNQEVLFEEFDPESLLPGYNVTPYTVSDAAVEGLKKSLDWAKDLFSFAQAPTGSAGKSLDAWNREQFKQIRVDAAAQLKKHAPGFEMEGLYETSHYEYQRRGGVLVKVPKDQGHEVWENTPSRKSKVLRHKAGKEHKHRYLRQVPEINENFQLSLQEQQPHMLTVAAWQKPGAPGRPGWVMAFSQVLVNGGGMSLVDPDGSGYGPTLVPVALFPEQGWTLQAPKLSYRYAWDKDLMMEGPAIGKAEQLSVEKALSLAQGALEALPLSQGAQRHALKALDFARELKEVQH